MWRCAAPPSFFSGRCLSADEYDRAKLNVSRVKLGMKGGDEVAKSMYYNLTLHQRGLCQPRIVAGAAVMPLSYVNKNNVENVFPTCGCSLLVLITGRLHWKSA
jgi:hypothetical protein